MGGVSLLLGDSLLLVLAVSLPMLLFLDLIRFKHLRTGSPAITLCMDVVWTGILAMAWVIRPPSAEYVMAFWSAGGLAALVIGLIFGGTVRWRAGDLRSFFRVARGISVPSALESLIFQFAWQLPFAIVLALVSLPLAGEYRAAVTLMAPAGVVVVSWTLSSYSRLGRVAADSARVYGLSVRIAVLCCLYLVVCLVFREELGGLLFQSRNAVSVEVLLLTGLQMPLLAFGSQVAVWFKLQRLVRYVLVARCISSVVVLALVLAGLNWHAVNVVLLSLPAGMMVQVLVMAVLRHRVLRDPTYSVVPTVQSETV